MRKLGRREFLKFASAVPAGFALSKLIRRTEEVLSPQSNIIIIVLDALSARNMSLYGYRRNTTPNIERFARRANVYHAHHSAGTFTTAGTASLLTGSYPWTHRAINLQGLVRRSLVQSNLFHSFNLHHRLAFTQNPLADYLLMQFEKDIERHLPLGAFSELAEYVYGVGGRDRATEHRALADLIFEDSPSSLVLGIANKYVGGYRAWDARRRLSDFQQTNEDVFFYIQKVFSGLAEEISRLEKPSVCYFHLYPPHAPYRPQNGFDEWFADGWNPKAKPRHRLWKEQSTSNKTLRRERLTYDQYLANTDSAFGGFVDQLEHSGVLENSFLIVTSDHGESFERGYLGHTGPYVYEPGIHIPLLISSPGQTIRRDFYSVTNSVDVLPTLLNLTGYDAPVWGEGEVLPGFSAQAIDGSLRTTFSMDAKNNSAFGDLSAISIAMRRGNHKLIYYKGYNDDKDPYHDGVFELYNLENDPEELENLVDIKIDLAHELKELLLAAYQVKGAPL